MPRPLGRPVAKNMRFLQAYFVTFQVVASYLSLKFQAKFRSAATIERLARKKHLRNARRIERAVARLQGLFIKVGQLISIMTNFLPEEFRKEFQGLQDQVPPRPFADIEARFREEFDGHGPREVFAEFEETPVASASIGQVHRARTHAGERVAVKVQYPDIEEIVRIDLTTLRRIFGVITWFLPYQGLDGVYLEIRAMIMQELDFRLEADHVERVAANFVGRKDIGFPSVRREFSTARVLTTEWIEGAKVSDKTKLAHLGVDPEKLARTIVAAYCQQIFTDGVYHADPHPGNLLVQPGGRVVFIDFGAVAEVSATMRKGIVDLIQAGLARDTPKLILAMKDMGFIARGADPAIFETVVDYLHQKFQEDIRLDSFSLKDVKFDPELGLERLADLRRMDVSLRDLADHFHIPKEWIMLERAVLLLMGLCTELAPEMNPMEVIRPYLEEFVLGKDRDWQAFALTTSKDLVLSAVALPGELKKFTAKALRGEMELRVRGLDEHARLLYLLGHQVIYAALAITAAVFWLVLDGRGRAVEALWASRGATGFGILLALSFLFNRSRGRRRRR
ncbi:MAG: AarF/ABC1/UbiB kinase family protein [Myxococcales bacterium]|nr:AarF/ABC1/UbiB kinase family protein [Myxococcales bacterium]